MGKETIKFAYENLPYGEKKAIRDIFIDLLKQNDMVVDEIQGLSVKSHISPDHPKLAKIDPDLRNAIGFPENLRRKDRRKVEKIEKKIANKLQAKAISMNFRGKNEENDEMDTTVA